ncbi:zinc finger protein 90 [Dermacentor silvarum]|uniref:zinc finger protein 90 n=1 Tax=Dermacentor silvarum TaxID=543639 RepID=UPI0021010A27|nr:zinc finger protein 90 [Dermacentor silvarum]
MATTASSGTPQRATNADSSRTPPPQAQKSTTPPGPPQMAYNLRSFADEEQARKLAVQLAPDMSTDNNVENIRKYFTDKEWQDLSVTKKLHYANLKANYDIMVKLGLRPQTPQFLKSKSAQYSSQLHSGAEQLVESKHAVFKCDTCGAYPCSAEHLEGHPMQQKAQRPQGRHKCSYCSYSTNHTYGANTAAHERTHIGQKPFVCYVCQKGFSQSSSLGQHINIHGQIKPYVCADCGRGFNASSNLARHRKLHSNAMEAHTCSLCYKSFSRKDNLKRHLLCHAAREWRSRL